MTPGARLGFRWRGIFAGITWKGLGLIVLLCVVNALRRGIRHFPDDQFIDGVLRVVRMTGFGLVVALPVVLAVVAAYNHGPPSPARRYPALAAAVLVSSMVGVFIMLVIESEGTLNARLYWSTDSLLGAWFQIWLRYAPLAVLFTAVYVYLRIAEESVARAREAEVDRARFDQQMDEARLQVLQAQIEPHFLFNTLSTVRRLYRTQPGSAVAMLDNLMRYLTVALPQMRARHSTLGRETALARAYLGIQQIRMGSRLVFEIDVPDTLGEVHVPPMMLLTLAENAIKHGLDPLPEGGSIRIGAAIEGDRLDLRVADSGRGFVETSGAGTGLANIRARLAAQYGPRARLELRQNRPRGITATISVPIASHTLPATTTS